MESIVRLFFLVVFFKLLLAGAAQLFKTFNLLVLICVYDDISLFLLLTISICHFIYLPT